MFVDCVSFNEVFNKHLSCWWFEIPKLSCYVTVIIIIISFFIDQGSKQIQNQNNSSKGIYIIQIQNNQNKEW